MSDLLDKLVESAGQVISEVDKGGQIGLWFMDAKNATFDDFAGGNVAP